MLDENDLGVYIVPSSLVAERTVFDSVYRSFLLNRKHLFIVTDRTEKSRVFSKRCSLDMILLLVG